MNSKTWTRIITLALFAALAMPLSVAAQEQRDKKEHHHYKLIDIGTLGGPNSFFTLSSVINSQGLAVAEAETSIPDPYSPNCLQGPDCLVNHGIAWKNGVQIDLGALPGGNNSSFPFWVNDEGTAVGLSENGVIDPLTGSPEVIAVLWKDGKIFDLGTLGGNASLATAINNRGQVAGPALNTIPDSDGNSLLGGGPIFPFAVATQVRAFLWDDRVMQDLGTLGTGNDAAALLVNKWGQVAGVSYTNTTPNVTTGIPTIDPFFWEKGKMVDIGTLGGTVGTPSWMNKRGQVVGSSNVAGDQFSHAFRWDKEEGLKDLGLLPGGNFAGANWINDSGEIVGGSDASSYFHAVLWKNGVIIDLGTVNDDTCSDANSINSKGQIVGFGSADCIHEDHAFLWENGGPIIDLNTLVLPGSGVAVTNSVFINDRGEIAASGMLSNGDQHAVLLIPCDERHPGIEGCDYSVVDAAVATESAAPRTVPRGTQHPPQSRRTNRYRTPDRGTGPTN